ncbi:hypothetical protein EDB83DRAFT_2335035 [Lactarius deliciosus]|nr:hypothetical protein EDB83DRAFT_2335035 [Lactarius deliciosus]
MPTRTTYMNHVNGRPATSQHLVSWALSSGAQLGSARNGKPGLRRLGKSDQLIWCSTLTTALSLISLCSPAFVHIPPRSVRFISAVFTHTSPLPAFCEHSASHSFRTLPFVQHSDHSTLFNTNASAIITDPYTTACVPQTRVSLHCAICTILTLTPIICRFQCRSLSNPDHLICRLS